MALDPPLDRDWETQFKFAEIFAVINTEISKAFADSLEKDVVGDLSGLNDALAIGIQKSFENVDLSGLDLTNINADKFDQAIDDAAASGNDFATQLKRLDSEISSVSFTTVLQKNLRNLERDESGRVTSVTLPGTLLTFEGLPTAPSETFTGLGAEALTTSLARLQQAISDNRSLLENTDALERTAKLLLFLL